MPYSVRHAGSKWQVVKDKTGEVIGTHKTKGEAIKQIYAIEMNEHKKSK